VKEPNGRKSQVANKPGSETAKGRKSHNSETIINISAPNDCKRWSRASHCSQAHSYYSSALSSTVADKKPDLA